MAVETNVIQIDFILGLRLAAIVYIEVFYLRRNLWKIKILYKIYNCLNILFLFLFIFLQLTVIVKVRLSEGLTPLSAMHSYFLVECLVAFFILNIGPAIQKQKKKIILLKFIRIYLFDFPTFYKIAVQIWIFK